MHSKIAFTEIQDTLLNEIDESVAVLAPCPIQTVDTALYPFGAGIIFLILAHPVYKM